MSARFTRRRLGEVREDKTDWRRVDALSDAEIAAAIAADPDTFEPEPPWFDQAMVLRPTRPKERITVRLDADMLRWFKAQGGGYQTRINAVLRAYYEAHKAKPAGKG